MSPIPAITGAGLEKRHSATLTNEQPPDLIIGQPNSYSTIPLTAGGLYYPTGLLVDPQGNLYIADSGNNRVLRYPKPFANTNAASPDIVLGQTDPYTSSKANQGGPLSAQTLCFYLGCPRGNGPYIASLAMDGSGNLFVSDAGNSRVLRFPSASLTAGALDPAADIVIGQAGFAVANYPSSATDKTTLYVPAGLAFDSSGNLFVSDSQSPFSRLVVYPPQVSNSSAGNGIAAIRFAGIVSPPPSTATASTLLNPSGVVMINNGPAVVDQGDNRLLIFDPFSSPDWGTTSGDTTLANPPPAALAVLGQGSSLTNFTSSMANAGNPQASYTSSGAKVATFSDPVAAAVSGNGDLFVVDAGNNRVLIYPSAGTVAIASGVLGQSDFPYSSINSIHGKEFYFGSGSSGDAGVAVDSSSSTPHLYVSDPNNNRVLGFADARKVGPGVLADIVLGEPDMMTALCNFGGVVNPPTEALPRQPTNASLCFPTGLAVDPGSGDLYVADSSNGRVLRFPAPFAAANSSEQANLVLGQNAFTGISNPTASQSVMVFPYGLVFDPVQGLFVSDEGANRVLLFPIASATNGEPATEVIGQTDFVSTNPTTFNLPHHIGEDSINRLYVSDYGNNRVLVFLPAGQITNQPIFTLTTTQFGGSLNRPQGIWVNPNTVAGSHDDIWVGDVNGLSHFASPSATGTGSSQATLTMSAAQEMPPAQSPDCSSKSACTYAVGALAVTQDALGNLYAADVSNRVAIHYQALQAKNSGSYVCYMGCTLGAADDPCGVEATGANVSCGLAPGTFATLYPFNFAFTTSAAYAASLPLPQKLAGLQVLVNGQPSPLSVITPAGGGGYLGQINFIVPYEAPTSGMAQVVVVNPSTSQVMGSGAANMGVASPAFFTNNGGGTGQLAALNCNTIVNNNCDDTRNGTANPVNPGASIQLFLNGTGPDLSGALPPDGASPGAVQTSQTPVVYVGSSQATVQYSGLAPGIPGLWQINIQIPTNPQDLQNFIDATQTQYQVYPVQIIYQGFATNYGANNANPNVAGTIVISGGS
jgi:uncharacterized protein (TIGR03437 family)